MGETTAELVSSFFLCLLKMYTPGCVGTFVMKNMRF